MEYVKIGKISLQNQGGFISKIVLWYTDQDGQERHTKKLTGNIDLGNSATIDPGDPKLKTNITDGTIIRMYAYVMAGNDNSAPQSFKYSKGNDNIAKYVIAGTTLNNFLGLIEPSPFLNPIKIGYFKLQQWGGFVAEIYIHYKDSPNGGYHSTWIEGGSKDGRTGNIDLGQSHVVDPYNLIKAVSKDANTPYEVYIAIWVAAGSDNFTRIPFLYAKGNKAMANFVSAGTTGKNYLGLIEITDYRG